MSNIVQWGYFRSEGVNGFLIHTSNGLQWYPWQPSRDACQEPNLGGQAQIRVQGQWVDKRRSWEAAGLKEALKYEIMVYRGVPEEASVHTLTCFFIRNSMECVWLLGWKTTTYRCMSCSISVSSRQAWKIWKDKIILTLLTSLPGTIIYSRTHIDVKNNC